MFEFDCKKDLNTSELRCKEDCSYIVDEKIEKINV